MFPPEFLLKGIPAGLANGFSGAERGVGPHLLGQIADVFDLVVSGNAGTGRPLPGGGAGR